MFSIYYNGLFNKIKITEVDEREKAAKICENHNKTLSKEMLRANIGNCFFIEN